MESRARRVRLGQTPPCPEIRWTAMAGFSIDWTSSKTGIWSGPLGHLRGQPAIRGLEIGCYEGRSTCWFVETILTGEGSTIECVDPWRVPGRTIERRFDRNVGRYGGKVVKSRAVSFDWMTARHAAGDRETFDFIYLDGDHSAAAVLADLTLCWPLLRPGGVLICDDYLFDRPGQRPRLAIDPFFQCRTDWTELHRDYQLIVRKKTDIEAVVVCVDYWDFLRHTLPMLVRHVDRVVVVTCAEDQRTAEVVDRVPYATRLVTDEFDRGRGVFNKGAAINDGLRSVSRSGWVLLCDADIVLTRTIPLPRRKDAIWGAARRRCRRWETVEEVLIDGRSDLETIPPVALRDGYAPSGYFQLWHWPTTPRWMSTRYNDASGSDIALARTWSPDRRLPLPEMEVLHLETDDSFRGANWRGRTTRFFCDGSTVEGDRVKSPASPRPQRRSDPERQHRGVLTAANSRYWPTLRLLAEAVRGANESLAVVDHGLTAKQSRWLAQQGVILHRVAGPDDWSAPPRGSQPLEPPSHPNAWLKPWLCVHSPFESTVWIDADAVPLRGLERMFEYVSRDAWLTLESWTSASSARKLYEPLLRRVLGRLPQRFHNAHRINTGVFGFRNGDLWLSHWWRSCRTIASDPALLSLCRLRDQAALVASLCQLPAGVDPPRIQLDRGLNWPVNDCQSSTRRGRKRYSWRDPKLLDRLRREHPQVSVVHWMGNPKPWQMG